MELILSHVKYHYDRLSFGECEASLVQLYSLVDKLTGFTHTAAVVCFRNNLGCTFSLTSNTDAFQQFYMAMTDIIGTCYKTLIFPFVAPVCVNFVTASLWLRATREELIRFLRQGSSFLKELFACYLGEHDLSKALEVLKEFTNITECLERFGDSIDPAVKSCLDEYICFFKERTDVEGQAKLTTMKDILRKAAEASRKPTYKKFLQDVFFEADQVHRELQNVIEDGLSICQASEITDLSDWLTKSCPIMDYVEHMLQLMDNCERGLVPKCL